MTVIIISSIVILLCIAYIIFSLKVRPFFILKPEDRRTPESYKENPKLAKYSDTFIPLLDKLNGLEYESVSITSFDGVDLQGRYYHVKDGAPVAIMFHGWTGHGTGDCCGAYSIASSLGNNVLIVDQRGCGISGKAYITFGIKECRDVVDWSKYVVERFGPSVEIILFGLSMGASSVLMATGEADLPANVRCCIADCGFSTAEEEMKYVISSKSSHIFANPLYALIRRFAKRVGRFNLDSNSAVAAVGRSKTPTLLIHGAQDDFVPYSMCDEIYNACVAPKYRLKVKGADHGCSYLQNIDYYADTVDRFLKLFVLEA